MTARTEVPAEFRSSEPEPSEKQISFINSLLDERQLPEGCDADEIARRKAALSKKQASAWITRLLELPKRVDARETHRSHHADLPDVPAGRYAVESEAGELRFYRVDRPAEGKWAGWVFVKVQHGPDESNIKGMPAKRAILGKIEQAGLREAALRYGREIGACSNCGRRLTNRVSRELAIGPVCGGRMFGDEFKDEVRSAREAIRSRGEDPDEEIA